ncbi:MAG: hypothetical protein RL220_1798 [Bacteroidota bacterium]
MDQGASVMLDLVRVVVAQIVVVTHCADILGEVNYPADRFFAEWGAIAIVIFFVLSGYVIAYSTLRRIQSGGDAYGFRDYFLERFVRIYTTLLTGMVFLGLLSLVAYFVWQTPLSTVKWNDAIGNVLMIVNHPVLIQLRKSVDASWIGFFEFKYWGGSLPVWTLSIEWWMYMCFGWILLAKSRSWYFWPVLILMGISPLMELIYGSRLQPGLPFFWCLGIAAVLMSNNLWKLPVIWSRLLMTICVFIILLAGSYIGWRVAGLVFFVFLMLTLSFYRNRETNISPRFSKIVKFMSGYSFMIYIVHFPVVQFVGYMNLPMSPVFCMTLAFVLSNVVSLGLALPTEMRYKQIRSYIFNRLRMNS